MDTEKLRYFHTIAQTENIRRAAEILHLTPSALSKAIANLEAQLGVKLVTPMGRGITLTPEGKNLAARSTSILDSLERLKAEIKEQKAERKEAPIRIATFEVFSTYFLHALNMVDIGNRGLVLHEVIPGELEQVIEQRKADVGITYMPIPHPNVEHVKVGSILMGVFKLRGAFKNKSQEELPFVVPAYPLSGSPTRVKGLDGWPETAYSRKIKFEVTLLESAMELCRQGRCVGYFPSFIVEAHNKKYKSEFQLERHPYEKSLARCYSDVYLVKRKDQSEDATIKMIAKMVRLGTKLEKGD